MTLPVRVGSLVRTVKPDRRGMVVTDTPQKYIISNFLQVDELFFIRIFWEDCTNGYYSRVGIDDAISSSLLVVEVY